MNPVSHAFSAELVADLEVTSREEWLRLRQSGLGGSDALVAMGMSTYKSPYVLYLEKTGQVGDLRPSDPNPLLVGTGEDEPAFWGVALEPIVAAEFSRRSGYKVVDVKALFRSTTYPWMMATTDRFVDTGHGVAILECKTRSAHSPLGWLSGEPPDYAVYQLHHYMIALGVHTGFLACLVGGQKFVWFEVPLDPKLATRLIDAESKLWDRIVNHDPPEPGGTPMDGPAIRDLYRDVDPERTVELGQAGEDILFRLLDFQKQEKAIKMLRLSAENELKTRIGTAEVGLVFNEPAVRWTASKSGRRFKVAQRWAAAAR
jgi:putative phage-type endonuclease